MYWTYKRVVRGVIIVDRIMMPIITHHKASLVGDNGTKMEYPVWLVDYNKAMIGGKDMLFLVYRLILRFVCLISKLRI